MYIIEVFMDEKSSSHAKIVKINWTKQKQQNFLQIGKVL